MDRRQLKELLDRAGVPPGSYDLNGGSDSEQLVLAHTPGVNWAWAVYYSERGLQTGRREFTTESEACEYVLRLLMDGT